MTKKRIAAFILIIISMYALAFLSFRKVSTTGKFVEKPPTLETDQILIKILIKTNESLSKEVRVMNIGYDRETISIASKGLEDIVSLSEKTFTLKPGQTKTIKITFSSVNEDGSIEYRPDVYAGKLVLKAGDFTKEIPVIVEIESGFLLFDMNMNIPVEYKKIKGGTDVNIEIRVFNLEGIIPASVKMHYSVKDMNGNTIITESETVVLQTQGSFTKMLQIPENIKSGTYVFAVKAEYGSSSGTSSYLFEVMGEEGRDWQTVLRFFVIFLITGLTIMILFLVYKKLIKKIRIKREPEDFSEIEERIIKAKELIDDLKKKKINTKSLEMDLYLAKTKLKKGMVEMAKEYLSRVEKKINLIGLKNG